MIFFSFYDATIGKILKLQKFCESIAKKGGKELSTCWCFLESTHVTFSTPSKSQLSIRKLRELTAEEQINDQSGEQAVAGLFLLSPLLRASAAIEL